MNARLGNAGGSGSGGGLTPRAVSSNSTASDGDLLVVTTGASDVTITPPAHGSGVSFGVAKADSGAGRVIVSATIAGVLNPLIPVQYGRLIFVSDGSAWWTEAS